MGAATTIVNAKVFDGTKSQDWTSVRFADGLITKCSVASAAQEGDEVIDAGGGTVLPGLIDAHVHLVPGALAQSLTFGVTTVLDMISAWNIPRIQLLGLLPGTRARCCHGRGSLPMAHHPQPSVSAGMRSQAPTRKRNDLRDRVRGRDRSAAVRPGYLAGYVPVDGQRTAVGGAVPAWPPKCLPRAEPPYAAVALTVAPSIVRIEHPAARPGRRAFSTLPACWPVYRSCRIAGVASSYIYAPFCMSLTVTMITNSPW